MSEMREGCELGFPACLQAPGFPTELSCTRNLLASLGAARAPEHDRADSGCSFPSLSVCSLQTQELGEGKGLWAGSPGGWR